MTLESSPKCVCSRMYKAKMAESILFAFCTWPTVSIGRRSDVFETTSKLVQRFGEVGCEIWPLPLTLPLAFNIAYCATTNMRDKYYGTIRKLLTYRVFLSIATDGDFSSRHGKVYKVTDGDWRFVWITGVDSQDVIAFTHCHGTVARYVTFIAWLRANVYLRQHNVINLFLKTP